MSLERTNKTISELLNMYSSGEIAIPEIQRDFVWKGDRIKLLLDSIYNDYPSGAIILWRPIGFNKEKMSLYIRPERLHLYEDNNKLPKYLLIDGQQRLTALASVILPEDEVMTKLGEEINVPHIFLNVKTKKVEFRAIKSKENHSSNDVLLNRILSRPTDDSGLNYITTELRKRNDVTNEMIKRLENLKEIINNYSYPVQIIETDNYSLVAEIFQRVNKQGKSLVTAEIELANIIPHWPRLSNRLRTVISNMKKKGFNIDLPFLMRCLAAVANNSAKIDEFTKRIKKEEYTTAQLEKVFERTVSAIEKLRDILHKYKIDRPEFITTKNSMVPIIYTIAKMGTGPRVPQKSLIEYILYSMAAGRYGDQSEGVLRKEFEFLSNERRSLVNSFNLMLKDVKNSLKTLKFDESDFEGAYLKNSMILLMYLALRQNGASDFNNKSHNTDDFSKMGKIHLHHIFPYDLMMHSDDTQKYREKKKLSKQEFKTEVNDIANITFISVEANENIKNKSPEKYFSNFASIENLKAHCIPVDTSLWTPDKYHSFLEERRKLLAEATNKYFKYLK